MIPHLRSTVITCVSVANSGAHLGLQILPPDPPIAHPRIEVLAEDFNVLTALVTSIPTFWGSAEVKAVCEVYIGDKIDGPKFTHYAEKLVKALSKHVSSKLLLASLLELWPSTDFVMSPVS